jgi:hypothetical protein
MHCPLVSTTPSHLPPAPPIQATKSWIALGRRPESASSLVEVYSDLFTALSYGKHGLSRPCTETVIYSREGVFFYVYEWREQAVHLQPTHLSSNEVILRFFESGADDKSTAAVWLSERQDAKGYIVTAQYMNKHDLRAFLGDSMNSAKNGVLQRYVTPRLIHDVEDVSHDLLVHYYNGSVVVERRRGVYPLDLSPHPTLACNTLPIIPVEGKIQTSTTMPFHPSEWRKSRVEVIDDADLRHACLDVCSEVRLSVEAYRTWEAHHQDLSEEEIAEAKGRGLRSFTLQMRVGRAERQLYLIGLLGMRYPPTRRRHEVDFHMTNCTPVADAPCAPHFDQEFNFPVVKAPPTLATANPHDTANLTEMFAFLKTEKPVLRYAIFDGEHYLCPNCDHEYSKEKFVRMTYAELAEHYLTHSACGKREMEALFPTTKATAHDDLLDRFSLAQTPSRPSTAKSKRPASARSTVPSADGQTSCAAAAPKAFVWKSLPPVLKKLNVALAELVASRPRLAQSAALCEGCAKLFGAVLADGASEAPQQQPGYRGTSSPLRRSPLFPDPPLAQRRPNSARPVPGAAQHRHPVPQCELMDQIVLTDLQRRHKMMRHAERAAQEALLAQQTVQPTAREIQHQRMQQQLEEEVEALLESFSVHPADQPSPRRVLSVSPSSAPSMESQSPQRQPSPTEVLHMGPGADVPLEMLLISELFYGMTEACNAAVTTRTSAMDPLAFVSSAPRKQGSSCRGLLDRGFPKPALLVPEDDLRPLGEPRRRQLEKEYLSVSRKATTVAMRRLSATYSDLSDAERVLLVDIAGTESSVDAMETKAGKENYRCEALKR